MIHISRHPQDMHFHALIYASLKDTAENRAGSCRRDGKRKKEKRSYILFFLTFCQIGSASFPESGEPGKGGKETSLSERSSAIIGRPGIIAAACIVPGKEGACFVFVN